MNIKGKLIEKFDTVKVTDTFQKREFVIEYAENPMYPEFVKFEMIQDRCALVDPFNVGDEIEVNFNLKGRKWTDPQGEVKYFNSLQAWRIDPVQGATMEQAAPAPTSTKSPTDAPAPSEPEWLKSSMDSKPQMEDDDLPF
ncbi:MAG: DUF3127 domain-containing protein [Cyclobacteriaceae bacterium]